MSLEHLRRLNKYRGERTSGYLFQTDESKNSGMPISTATVRNIVKEACDRAGVEALFTPHSFRSTIASYVVKEGGDPKIS